MSSLTRRDFLKFAGIGSAGIAAAIALAACAKDNGSTENKATEERKASDIADVVQTSDVKTEEQQQVISEVLSTEGYRSLQLVAGGDPGSLFPYGTSAMSRGSLTGLMYETLLTQPYKEMIPKACVKVLAKEVTLASEGVYDVEIYDCIYDTDGNHLTASDVVYSFNLCIEDGNQRTNLRTLKSFEATGEYTIRFTFEGEKKYNMEQALGAVKCVTQAAWEASPDGMTTTPVGTGKFILGDHETGAFYTFLKKEDYWKPEEFRDPVIDAQNIDAVTYNIITDSQTVALALENREIDQGGVGDADLYNFINEDGTPKEGYYAECWPRDPLMHIMFNCGENSPCQDINLRKAIVTAIDAAAICELNWKNLGHPGVGYGNPCWLDCDIDALQDAMGDYFPFDVEQAKQYLKESSYQGETLRILVNPVKAYVQCGTLTQAYLQAIGINIELLNYEAALYEEEHKDTSGLKYDMDIVFGKSNYATWSGCFEFDAKSYTTGLNHNYIYDEKLQELYDKLAAPTSTMDDIIEFNKYVAENVYGYTIGYYDSWTISTDKFLDFYCTNTGIIPGASVVKPD